MKMLCKLLGFLCLIGSLSAANPEKSYIKKKMLGDLAFIKNTFDVCYAPKDWKRNYSGWDLEREAALAEQEILSLSHPKTKDFHRILNRFIRSTKDYHCSIGFYSTESATLPFRIRGHQGKYFFIYINREHLPQEIFPFSIGDELVSFDGEPTDRVVQRLKKQEAFSNNAPTDQTFAEIMLTERDGFQGVTVPRGSANIEIRPKGAKETEHYQLVWDYTPEMIKNPLDLDGSDRGLTSPHLTDFWNQDPLTARKHLMLPAYYLKKCKERWLESEPGYMGSRKSLLPPLGKIVWESPEESHFYAYLFKTSEGKKVGYIRIPSYDGGGDEVNEFGEVINYFEKNAKVLVVDQLDNPGGYLFYMYALASTLAKKPLDTPKHRIAITQEEVMEAMLSLPLWESIRSTEEAISILGDNLLGYPISSQLVLYLVEYYRFIIDQWNEGKILTSPHHLEGVDQINPHPKYRFTKPILMLVNENCFSGGDFMPAILQDNKRATIFGKKTAGAGGFVLPIHFPNRWGIAAFSLTGSIAERSNKQPIENLGVTPDIVYDISEQDLTDQFWGYRDAVLTVVHELMH